MSTRTTKRKRARKACLPCHERKRKCDAGYPCNMCTTYGYDCKYTGGDILPIDDSIQDVCSTRPNGVGDKISGTDRSITLNSRGARSHSIRRPSRVEKSSRSLLSVTYTSEPTITANAGAMEFPHILGVALGSTTPPKVHSFAYNFGIRPEEASVAHGSLRQLISEEDLERYSRMYFFALATIGDVVDPEVYTQRCRDYYHGSGSATSVAFGALAAGIAALGSFLSSDRHPRESDLVQYAKAILDDPATMRQLDIDHVVAWGTRFMYLRATAGPSTAWIASCTTMHLCEIIGLHNEDKIQKMVSASDAVGLGRDADRLRRIFWISWAGHTILSYEYDRPAVYFRSITCKAILPKQGSLADQFVQIAQIIPSLDSPFRLEEQFSNPADDLSERLKIVDRLPFTDPFLIATKAEVAFCFYRRIYQHRKGISDEIAQLIVKNGNAALEAAEGLAEQGRLFWNVIGSVFQYTCVLLAINTPIATDQIPYAFGCLENLVKIANTKITREALSIARHLLNLNLERKRKELALLESLGMADDPSSQTRPDSEVKVDMPDNGLSLDWDQFLLEPYLSLFE